MKYFGASLLGNLLTGNATIRAGKDTVRAGQGFLIPSHPLKNLEK